MCFSLLDVYLCMLNAHVSIFSAINRAHSNLHIIADGRGKLLVEPRRVVERAAGAGRAAPSTVPQRRRIIKPIVIDVAVDSPLKPGVAKVVLPHIVWRSLSRTLCVGTLAVEISLASILVQCRCKGPDVLSGVAAMGKADTVKVNVINTRVIKCCKNTSNTHLIAQDLTTDSRVCYAMSLYCY